MSKVDILKMNKSINYDVNTEKKIIVHNIKHLFEKNNELASYSIFLSTCVLDEIFNLYLIQYVGKVDLDDKENIRIMLENALRLNLNDLMNEIELLDMYNFSKQYIQLMITGSGYPSDNRFNNSF